MDKKLGAVPSDDDDGSNASEVAVLAVRPPPAPAIDFGEQESQDNLRDLPLIHVNEAVMLAVCADGAAGVFVGDLEVDPQGKQHAEAISPVGDFLTKHIQKSSAEKLQHLVLFGVKSPNAESGTGVLQLSVTVLDGHNNSQGIISFQKSAYPHPGEPAIVKMSRGWGNLNGYGNLEFTSVRTTLCKEDDLPSRLVKVFTVKKYEECKEGLIPCEDGHCTAMFGNM